MPFKDDGHQEIIPGSLESFIDNVATLQLTPELPPREQTKAAEVTTSKPVIQPLQQKLNTFSVKSLQQRKTRIFLRARPYGQQEQIKTQTLIAHTVLTRLNLTTLKYILHQQLWQKSHLREIVEVKRGETRWVRSGDTSRAERWSC